MKKTEKMKKLNMKEIEEYLIKLIDKMSVKKCKVIMTECLGNRAIKIEINGKFNAIFLKSKIKKRFIKLIFTQKNNGEIDGLRLHNFKSEYGYKRGKFKVIYPEMNENHN